MAKHKKLQTFYASDTWRNFRMRIIAERGLRCEYCKERVVHSSELTLHHIIELTPENVDDRAISLNPDNIQVVHHTCHNKIHRRGKAKTGQQVHIVYGPPLSGKTSYVKDRMTPGDLVVDYDSLFVGISMLPIYEKPNEILPNVRLVHSQLIDNIKTRYGRWNNAWIIGGYADKYRREKLARETGAELVFIQASREECMERLKADPNRKKRIAEWTGYIDKWFETYGE
jgi:hypothetical protein